MLCTWLTLVLFLFHLTVSAQSGLILLGGGGEAVLEISADDSLIGPSGSDTFSLQCSNGFALKDAQISAHSSKSLPSEHRTLRVFIGKVAGNTNVNCTFINSIGVSKLFNSTFYEESPTFCGAGMAGNPEFTVESLNPEDYLWDNNALQFDAGCEAILSRVLPAFPNVLPTQAPTLIAQKIKEGCKFHISMTTSPSRLTKLHYTLRTLSHMTFIESIIITLPRLFKNTQAYIIPKQLQKEFPKIQFLSASLDVGPSLKLVGAVQWLKSQGAGEDYILYLDDDGAYGLGIHNLFSELLALEKTGHKAAVGGSNLNFGFPTLGFPRPHRARGSRAVLLEGFAGVAIQVKNVDQELIVAASRRDLNGRLAICHHSDDVVVSYCLALCGVELYGATGWNKGQRMDFPHFQDSNALHKISHDDKPGGKGHFTNYRQALGTLMRFAFAFDRPGVPFVERDEFLKNVLASYSKPAKTRVEVITVVIEKDNEIMGDLEKAVINLIETAANVPTVKMQ